MGVDGFFHLAPMNLRSRLRFACLCLGLSSTPLVFGQTIYVGSNSNAEVYQFDATTGGSTRPEFPQRRN